MNKFDNIIKSIEDKLLLESPRYYKDQKLQQKWDADDKHDVEEIKKEGIKQQNFEDFEVYLIETSLITREKVLKYVFIKDNEVQSILGIIEEMSVSRISPRTPIKSEKKYILFAASQKNKQENKGLARRIILSHLSNVFPHLISGTEANEDGKPFLEKLLRDAKQKGFKVLGSLHREEIEYKPEDFEKYWEDDEPTPQTLRTRTSAEGKYFKIVFKDEN